MPWRAIQLPFDAGEANLRVPSLAHASDDDLHAMAFIPSAVASY